MTPPLIQLRHERISMSGVELVAAGFDVDLVDDLIVSGNQTNRLLRQLFVIERTDFAADQQHFVNLLDVQFTQIVNRARA